MSGIDREGDWRVEVTESKSERGGVIMRVIDEELHWVNDAGKVEDNKMYHCEHNWVNGKEEKYCNKWNVMCTVEMKS